MNIKEILQEHNAYSHELERRLIMEIQCDPNRPPMKSGMPPSPLEEDESQWLDHGEVPSELMTGYFVAL